MKNKFIRLTTLLTKNVAKDGEEKEKSATQLKKEAKRKEKEEKFKEKQEKLAIAPFKPAKSKTDEVKVDKEAAIVKYTSDTKLGDKKGIQTRPNYKKKIRYRLWSAFKSNFNSESDYLNYAKSDYKDC
jgi:hypothetical protein